MADISKIKLPNGVSYDIKDATARTPAGSSTNPVYINSSGKAVACSAVSSGSYKSAVPSIDSSGIMEAGSAIDFHTTASTNDYDVRVSMAATNSNGSCAVTVAGNPDTTTNYLGVNFSTKNYTSRLRAYDIDTNGHNIVFQSGGNMVIGSGESADNFYNADKLPEDAWSDSGENLYLMSDDRVKIITNANTIANRKVFTFSNDGTIVFPVSDNNYTSLQWRYGTSDSYTMHLLRSSGKDTPRIWNLPDLSGELATRHGYYSRIYSTSETWSDTPWFKAAEITRDDAAQTSFLYLAVYGASWIANSFGILQIPLRGDTTKGTVSSVSQPRWLLLPDTADILPENFVLVITSIENTSYTAELWVKATGRYRPTVLKEIYQSSEHNDAHLWTFYQNPTGAASYTSGGTVYTSQIEAIQNPVVTETITNENTPGLTFYKSGNVVTMVIDSDDGITSSTGTGLIYYGEYSDEQKALFPPYDCYGIVSTHATSSDYYRIGITSSYMNESNNCAIWLSSGNVTIYGASITYVLP